MQHILMLSLSIVAMAIISSTMTTPTPQGNGDSEDDFTFDDLRDHLYKVEDDLRGERQARRHQVSKLNREVDQLENELRTEKEAQSELARNLEKEREARKHEISQVVKDLEADRDTRITLQTLINQLNTSFHSKFLVLGPIHTKREWYAGKLGIGLNLVGFSSYPANHLLLLE